MASVRSEVAPKRPIFQRLFYPLHIKLPIEALATIFIAVATIYVFKTTYPEMERAKAPPAEITSRIPLEDREKTATLDEGKALPAKPTEEPMLAEEPRISPGKSLERPKAPAIGARQDEVEPSTGAIGKRHYKRKALSPELKAALIEKEQKGVSLIINVNDIDIAGREIEKVLMKLGGKIITGEYSEQRNIIAAELDAEKVKDLLEKLKILGEIKGNALTLEAREGDIDIRIEIAKIPVGP